ncbi:hypothetical protein SteCoe_32846 [Stentor coeruleus]|uniref:Transmembrane protein 230 n=1 Tax=Stentor coeruleus TaxID=5963 RepID=A0A1R2AY24_9CILI|nr:hypothetical protein SteCoe_32846 [Stentor coeruleus]
MLSSRDPEASEVIGTEPLPPFPFVTLILYTIGIVLGIFFILIGFIEEATGIDAVLGATFWILGGFLLIPSIFYSIMMIKALKTDQAGEYIRIIKNIPQL